MILSVVRGPFYEHGLTVILACISNWVHDKVGDQITYQFRNINGYTINYLSMLGLKLTHVSKRAPDRDSYHCFVMPIALLDTVSNVIFLSFSRILHVDSC